VKYTVRPTSKFKKDLKLAKKRGYNLSLLKDIIYKLANGESLPPENHDHPLTGNFSSLRECHIEPDWLLVYETDDNSLYLYLTRTGTHSDIF